MADLSPILQAAKDILAAEKGEMHVNDIAKAAAGKNKNLGMTEEVFAARLSSALAAHMKLKDKKAIAFSKPLNKTGGPRKGIWRLKTSRAPSLVTRSPPPQVSTDFLGKAGEHAVMSELLFWGYNVSMMTVDQGIDLVASKDNKYHHVQVKTTSPSDGSETFSFQIKQKSFDANHGSNMWYVFVMRKNAGVCEYAVIPSSHLHNLRNLGVIGGQNLSVQISSQDKGRRYVMNNRDDISLFINNFAIIT